MPMHGKKKKTKMMARGGYGTPTKKMNVNKPKATKMMYGGMAKKKMGRSK
tara:strand:- start:450 stop:599 length:150 start_codon:yes stop_codon:yes gene_type:complete